MTTVFIVAAADVVRAGLASLIANDARFTVVGSATELAELTTPEAESVSPDVVIVEAEDEETSTALRAFIEERNESEDFPALVVIGAEQSEWMREALSAGMVRAVLPRTATSDEIIAAVEAVSAGLVVLDAETFSTLLAPQDSNTEELAVERPDEERLPPIEPKGEALTPREREVLEMLAEGLSNKEIAWRMKISEHTVKFHVASIFAKLDVSTRTEAVMQGVRKGLVMM